MIIATARPEQRDRSNGVGTGVTRYRFLHDWETTTLGDIADIKNGATPRTTTSTYWEGDIPWCTPSDITRTTGKYLLTTERSITPAGLASCNATLLPIGTLLLCSRATIGAIKIAAVPVCTNQGFKALVCKDTVSGEFLYYLILTLKHRLVARAMGSTFLEIGKHDLANIVLELPKLDEQYTIVTVLSAIDCLTSALDKLINKKLAIRLAVRQQLLTGQSRLPGFTREWKTKRIGDFAFCTSGGTPSTLVRGYWGGPIRWMISGELNTKVVYDVKGRITERGLRESSARLLPPRCVLIGLAGQGKTRGTVAINQLSLSTNQSIGAIYPNDSFVPEYLYHNLRARYYELRRMSTGDGGRGGLNLSIMRSITVPFPEIEEQQAIATVLSDIDAEIASVERRRDKIRDIKQGMMQQLLTGSIRLVKPD